MSEKKSKSWNVQGRFVSKNCYDNLYFVIDAKKYEDSFNVAKSLRSFIDEKYNPDFNPIWISDDSQEANLHARVVMDKIISTGSLARAKPEHFYELSFNVIIRKSMEGKKYLILRLTKQPKLINVGTEELLEM